LEEGLSKDSFFCVCSLLLFLICNSLTCIERGGSDGIGDTGGAGGGGSDSRCFKDSLCFLFNDFA
jgi:hypothetical protein